MSTNLGDLLKKAGLQAGPPAPEPEPGVVEVPEPGAWFARKVVLRTTRAGRSGKLVTAIQGVLRDHELLAQTLRKQLGVGVTVEDEQVLVQGDQTKRLDPLLRAQGAKTIILG